MPLLPPDEDVRLTMAGIFDAIYGDARYDLRIDYTQPLPPPPPRPGIAE